MLGRRTTFTMNTLRKYYPQGNPQWFHTPKHPPKNFAHIHTNNLKRTIK